MRARLRLAARVAILESAEAVFADRGIQTARVEEIAARAGVSVGTLYNYFGDRQGLVEALLDSEREQLLAKADEALSRAHGRPFAKQLEGLLDATLAHFQEHRQLFTLLSDAELCEGRAAMRRHTSVMKEMLSRVERLAQRGLKEGAISSRHAEVFPAVVVGCLRGLFGKQVLLAQGKGLSVTGADLVDLFLNGAGKRS